MSSQDPGPCLRPEPRSATSHMGSPTPLGPPQTLGYWCSSDSQRNKGEEYRGKRLTKDVEFKSSQVGQLGGTVGHQAAVRALVFPGHGIDGKCACGEKRARDGLGVIGENP